MYGIEIIFVEKCLAVEKCNSLPIATLVRDSHFEVVIGWAKRGINSGVEWVGETLERNFFKVEIKP